MSYHSFVFAIILNLLTTSYLATQNNDDFEYNLFEYHPIESKVFFLNTN